MRQAVVALIVGIILCAQTQPGTGNFTGTEQETLLEIERLHLKADELISKHELDGAIRLFWEIILLEPDDDRAYAELGRAYLILGDIERARDAFLNALDINPENDLARLGLEKLRD